MRRRLAGLVVLGGCGAPISNDVFYEDEAFLAPLPSEARLALPDALVGAEAGDCAVFAAALDAADSYTDVVAPIIAAGEALRVEPPDTRTESLRAWEAVTVAAETGAGAAFGWVSAEIVRPDDGAATWTMSIAADAGGPWIEVAAGDGDTAAADFTWSLDASDPVFGLSIGGSAAVGWAGETTDTQEVTVDLRAADAGTTVRSWATYGGLAFGWTGTFSVTDDGEALPGWAVALHQGDGGRAEGAVVQNDGESRFVVCWDADGDVVYEGGDAGMNAGGDEGACVVGAFADL